MSQSPFGDVSGSSAPVQQSETPAVNFLCDVGNWLHTRSMGNEYFLDTEFRDKIRPGLDWSTVDPESEGIASSETRMAQSGVDRCVVRDMADKDIYTLTQDQFDYIKTRILIEQNSRLTSLPLPPDQTSYQVGNADGPQIQVPPDWIGDESAIFPPHGLNETVQTMPMSPPGGQSQNTTVQTMPMSSSFTFSLTGARSTIHNVYFHRAPYEGSGNTTGAMPTEGQCPLPGP